MNCPSCKSENTKKQELIFEEGSSDGVSDFSGSSSEGKSISGSLENNSITKLAVRCAPPKAPWPSFFFHLFAFIAPTVILLNVMDFLPSFMSGFLTSLGKSAEFFWFFYLLACSMYFLRYKLWSKRLWSQYHSKHEKWGKSWLCMKCGHMFEQS